MFGKSEINLLVLAAIAVGIVGTASGQISIPMVTVGDAGNAADPLTGFGAVPYAYQIGKYDVTVSEYCDFLNSVAVQSDLYGLYDIEMSPTSNFASCGIVRLGSLGSYTYSYAISNANFPVNQVSFGDALRFANWLSNGQPDTGVENASTTEDGSYAINGAVTDQQLNAVVRSPNATYVIPSENEFYKASFFQPGTTDGYWLYPTQSDSPPSNVLSMTGTNNANFLDPVLGGSDPTTGLTPVGAFADSPGPYGTYDQGGDVFQWTEGTEGSARVTRGGPFDLGANYFESDMRLSQPPSSIGTDTGFRIAEVPEPSSILLIGLGTLGFLARRRHG